MPDEATCKALALEHCRRVNAGDVERLLELYAPAVRFEDPVGSVERVGHGALRSYIGGVIAAGVQEAPEVPVAAPDGRHAAVPVTVTMSYLPNGPLLARFGLLPAPPDPRTARLRFSCVMVIGVGPGGLIDEMRTYWGPSDVRFLGLEAAAAAGDASAKATALGYCRLMNAGDLDAVLALFAADVRFEDPVGSPPVVGLDALRTHLASAIGGHIHEVPGTPTGCLRGDIVALPVSGTLDAPGAPAGTRVRFNLISLIRTDAAGLISEVRVLAGRTDYRLVDPAD
ncbi:MAG TPA: nuclear transport factor 2 family protein [Micromonosporaceae bacterium]|nr:nuclear transport factor 2 family protein [Micromonosporaceae bacterium]